MAQYLHFYGFAKAPFCPGANSEELYWSPSRRRLCSSLARAITERRGLIMLTGEEGVGKTTLLHAALESIKTQTLKAISIPAAPHSFWEILRMLSWELGIDARAKELTLPPASQEPPRLKLSARRRERSAILRSLTKMLVDAEARGMCVVLVLDDAHSCSVRTLQQLQRLTMLEAKGRPLLQIVLVGRPDLEQKLNLLPLWRLRRQLALRVFLPRLTSDESLSYLRHRLAAAAQEEEPAFAPDTFALLAAFGDGNPYRLNVLGHNALLKGYETQQPLIPPEILAHILQEVGTDLKKNVNDLPSSLSFLRIPGTAMVASGITVLFLAGLLSLWQGHAPTVVSSDVEPTLANAVVAAANREVTTSENTMQQPPVMSEKRTPVPPVVPNPPPPQGSSSSMVKVTSPVPATSVKSGPESQSIVKLKPQQTQSKAVAITPTKKPKDTPPAKVGNMTNRAKAKMTATPQQSAVVKHTSPLQKNPSLPPRAGQQPQAKTQTSKANHDGLFDE